MSSPLAAEDVTVRPLWTPSAQRQQDAIVTTFCAWLQEHRKLNFTCYEELWQWSVDHLDEFWSAVWEFFDLHADQQFSRVLADQRMPGTQWLEGARLNLVDQILRHRGLQHPAIIFESESLGQGTVSWPELCDQVAAMAACLQSMGVQPGDRVAAILPNVPQAVVGFLAAASIGAVWSLCSPDMGPVSVGDRFRQIEPKVLIACDGYQFGGKAFDRRENLKTVLTQLPSVTHLIWVSLMGTDVPKLDLEPVHTITWDQGVRGVDRANPIPLPADHPLWILYSSGTTGLPKAIVHGHGGILLNGLASFVLHGDLHCGDRILWAVNTSWMVWNAHVLSLLGGASIVLYDGSITGSAPQADWGFLWRLAARHDVNVLGAGAAFFHSCIKAGVKPAEMVDLPSLTTVCSTGSPLTPEAYQWMYQSVKSDLWLNTVSGGTDIAGGFLVGLPTLPVYIGEMQCRALGAAVQAFDDNGHPLTAQVGELVCTKPLPSMPLFFWNDTGHRREIESYFDMYRDEEGGPIWRHGDWLKLVPRPKATGGIIYGRSDATINRQGIRMGTSELYRAVESIEEVVDSLVVDLEYLGRESYMALFVVLRSGVELNPELDKRVRQSIRQNLSPRHVPNEIVACAQIPKTLSGKKLELPVKKLMMGLSADKVVNRDALANPDSMDWFITFAQKHLERTNQTPGEIA